MGQCHEAGLLDIDQETIHAAIADALGISVAEFEAARAKGTPLNLIAQQHGNGFGAGKGYGQGMMSSQSVIVRGVGPRYTDAI